MNISLCFQIGRIRHFKRSKLTSPFCNRACNHDTTISLSCPNFQTGFWLMFLEEITDMFAKIRAGRFHTDERSVLQITHTDGRPIAPLNFALNEITVIRQNSTAMITVEAYLNDQYLTSYWADGLIIATPTGSTGYSLSCGGPVIMPHSKTLALTPIAPHNLNARPLIIPDSTEITLHVSNREGCYLATYDARSAILPCETSVKISLAPFHLKTIELEGNDFFKTLRNKLLWGEDKRN